jgi:hypothetical protein
VVERSRAQVVVLRLVETGEGLVPHAGEARVITGGARNTEYGANGFPFFTSGTLLPLWETS